MHALHALDEQAYRDWRPGAARAEGRGTEVALEKTMHGCRPQHEVNTAQEGGGLERGLEGWRSPLQLL